MPLWDAPSLRLASPRTTRKHLPPTFSTSGLSTLQDLLARPPRDAPVGGAYQRPFKVAYDHLQREQELSFLEETFRALDSDGSGQVSYAEFVTCINDPATFAILNRRFGVQRHETPRIFRALDIDGSGEVSLNEWMETCKVLMSFVQEGDHITDWRLHEIRKRLRSYQSAAVGMSPRREVTARRPATAAAEGVLTSVLMPWDTPRKPTTATPRRRRRPLNCQWDEQPLS